jgi:hypothetical protein
MIAAGFKKAGRTYRLEPASGGAVIVAVDAHPLGGGLVPFFVDTAVSPDVLVQYELRELPEVERRAGNLSWGSWVIRLEPRPGTVEYARPFLPEAGRAWFDINPPWAFPKDGDWSICGDDLRERLNQAIPELQRLTDADALLDAVRAGPPPLALQLGRDRAEVLLMSAAGDSTQLRELIARLDEKEPDNPVTSWLRQRVGL